MNISTQCSNESGITGNNKPHKMKNIAFIDRDIVECYMKKIGNWTNIVKEI